jgi:hypothetical protein
VDLTQIPKQLDAQFEALDEDSALRPTVIKTGVCSRVCVRHFSSLRVLVVIYSLRTASQARHGQGARKKACLASWCSPA